MNKNMLAISLAAAMESMQTMKPELITKDHKINGNIGFNGFNRNQAKSKSFKPKSTSKYKSHQGKQECTRRLKVYSPAWYSSQTYAN